MNLQGKIKSIDAIIERGASNFKTRKIVLDRTTVYEGRTNVNFTEISLLGDKTALPETLNLKPGDFIKCDFNIEGRYFDYQGEQKFSQEVKVWKIEVVGQSQPTPAVAPSSTDGMP